MDQQKCTGCGVCEQVCPVGVFSVLDRRASVSAEDNCINCKNCEVSCQTGCITVET